MGIPRSGVKGEVERTALPVGSRSREIVRFGIYREGTTAEFHDILVIGCEKVRECKESSQFVLC